MHISFFDNGNLSYLFAELAKRFNQQGVTTSILCLSRKKADQLQAAYGVKTIVIATDEPADYEAGCELVRQVEQRFEQFTLNKAILVDRVLREWEFAKAQRLLCSFAGNLKKVVTEANIDFIVGEVTWGVEL